MFKNSLIILLALLLAAASFLLYKNKNISIVVEGQEAPRHETIEPHEGFFENEIIGSVPDENLKDTDIKEDIEPIGQDSYDPYLDPTLRLTINEDREIVTEYRIIGPRKFSLLTEDEKPVVEIDLDSGQVKINPDFPIDEASREFWRSIGKTYPEVCFVE